MSPTTRTQKNDLDPETQFTRVKPRPRLIPWVGSASFSEDRVYRYLLRRVWDEKGADVLFIMLNPSTADAMINDPSVARCVAYAQRWGFGSVTVCNLFALRSTDPKQLYRSVYPVAHPDEADRNDDTIVEYAARAGNIVCAWGKHGAYLGRGHSVLRLLRGYHLRALTVTKDGHPGHPLYLRGDAQSVRYAR